MASAQRTFHESRPGFTLIEILVVLAIVLVLIAITLPALAGARVAGLRSVTRSNIRQSAVSMFVYTDTHRGAFPWRNASDWIPLDPPSPDGSVSFSVVVPYFNLFFFWQGLMHGVAPWSEHYRSWLAGGVRHGEPPWRSPEGGYLFPSFHLAEAFLARPELWRSDAQEDDTLYRPVFAKDVLFPSQKAMMLTSRQALPPPVSEPDPKTILAMADGSVRDERLEDATPPEAPPWKSTDPQPVHDTPDGVRGVDY